MTVRRRILVVEDEEVIRQEIRRMLVRKGYEVVEAPSVEAALALQPERFDLVLSDLRLPGEAGLGLVEALEGKVPVLIMTAFATVKSAVEAMKVGAADYISKPFESEELLGAVRRLLEPKEASSPSLRPSSDLSVSASLGGMVASCGPMVMVLDRVARVAPTSATVLVLGESGTGKELVARGIHSQSLRKSGPFVAVNCAAIPDALVESELFGHEKGAFTSAEEAREGLVAASHGGTLFLDEVGELPLAAQARLLRLLQESEIRPVGSNLTRKVDVRIVAATHRNLPQLVEQRSFREDLYFRLKVVDIALPPLRERGPDLLSLARHLLVRVCQRIGRTPMTLSAGAEQALTGYDWPGNVRELENVLERAVIMADGDELTGRSLDLPESKEVQAEAPAKPALGGAPSEASLTAYFRRFVESNQDQMSETELAKQLGISRKALWEKRRRMGIPRPKSRSVAPSYLS